MVLHLFYQTKLMSTTTKYIPGTYSFLDQLIHLDKNTNKNSKGKHNITFTEYKAFYICFKGVFSNDSHSVQRVIAKSTHTKRLPA